MLISPAYAQTSSPFGNTDMLTSLLPFALIFVIMYFLILRPQQKRVKQHAEMVKNVRKGDTVVTSGGLVGRVTKVTRNTATVRLINDPELSVSVRFLARECVEGQPVTPTSTGWWHLRCRTSRRATRVRPSGSPARPGRPRPSNTRTSAASTTSAGSTAGNT